MASFFPLRKDLIEHEHFKGMPAAHRLYFLLLVSEFNLKGTFYKSDLEAAVTINTSLDTIRRARRELQRLEWIEAQPGFLSARKKPIATRYFHVKFAQVEDGQFFAKIHRYAFQALLHRTRAGHMDHKELLLFCYVCYFNIKYREAGEKDFFISKRELIELTGMTEAPAAVLRLHQHQVFGDEGIFEIVDVYHKIKILQQRIFADPEEDEHNRNQSLKHQEDIKKRVEAAKKKPLPKKKRKNKKTAAERGSKVAF